MHGDIGIGLIVSWMMCTILGVEPTWVHALMGAVFALSPDTDAVIAKFLRGTISVHAENPHDHRDLFHYPVLFVPIGSVIVLSTCLLAGYGLEFVWIFAIASLLHFVHDSFGIGWGVRWLWPLSKKSYKFFVEKDNTSSRTIIQSWTPHELSEAQRLFGLPSNVWIPAYLRGDFFRFEVIILLLGMCIWTFQWTR